MSSGAPLEIVDVAAAHVPDLKDEHIFEKRESLSFIKDNLVGPNGELYPTDEEWASLRRVYGKVNWMIYIIGIVEMCERFAYYGTTAVCKCNLRLEAVVPLTRRSCQLHPTISANRGTIPRSWCCWHQWSTRSSGYGTKSLDRTCAV
jgi:hypothetical protein